MLTSIVVVSMSTVTATPGRVASSAPRIESQDSSCAILSLKQSLTVSIAQMHRVLEAEHYTDGEEHDEVVHLHRRSSVIHGCHVAEQDSLQHDIACTSGMKIWPWWSGEVCTTLRGGTQLSDMSWLIMENTPVISACIHRTRSGLLPCHPLHSYPYSAQILPFSVIPNDTFLTESKHSISVSITLLHDSCRNVLCKDGPEMPQWRPACR